MHEYCIASYEVVNMNRKNKRGGGVMIYISKHLRYKLVKNMCEVIDNVYQCVTVELDTEQGTSTIISCIYRTPCSNIDTFIENLDNPIQTGKNTSVFLVGDFNINLLNYETHTGTRNFIDTLFSYSIRPLVTQPTRITLESSTLIDYILQITQNHIKVESS